MIGPGRLEDDTRRTRWQNPGNEFGDAVMVIAELPGGRQWMQMVFRNINPESDLIT